MARRKDIYNAQQMANNAYAAANNGYGYGQQMPGNGYGAYGQQAGYGGYNGYGAAGAQPGAGGPGMPGQGMPGQPGQPNVIVMMPQGGGGGDNKKKKGGWGCLFWLAMLIFLACIAALGVIFYTYMHQSDMYDKVAEEYAEITAGEDSATGEPVFNIDWDGLRAINPEVIAWLYVPDTPINYPVLHKPGDSEYYLHYNFRNETYSYGAEYGAIFLSGDNRANFEDKVNVFYGHNMRNGTMFAILNQFQDNEVFNAHRTIYLITPEGYYKLRTFALDHVHDTDTSVVIPNPNNLTDYIQDKIDNSIVVPEGSIPSASSIDQVFVFSTCDGADNTNRYVTFAYSEHFYSNTRRPGDAVDEPNAEDIANVVDTDQARRDNEGYAPEGQ